MSKELKKGEFGLSLSLSFFFFDALDCFGAVAILIVMYVGTGFGTIIQCNLCKLLLRVYAPKPTLTQGNTHE